MNTLPWHREIAAAAAPTAATLVVGHTGSGVEYLALALAAKFAGGPVNAETNAAEFLPSPSSSDTADDELAAITAAADNVDIMISRPEKNIIAVATVRQVIEFCALSPMVMARRVAVFMQAEKLNTHAANALLKTLEEPGTDKCLILSAHAASLLPPTIVSRCHILLAPTPDWTQATAWLQARGSAAEALAFAGGMPIAALSADLAGAKAAAKFFARGKKMNLHATAAALMDYENWLDCLQKWTADGARAAAGLSARYFPGAEKSMQTICTDMRRWLEAHARLLEKRRLATHPLAKDLFIKDTLYEYRRLVAD